MISRVYLVEIEDGAPAKEQARAIGRLYETAEVARTISRQDLVAVKVHVGEKGNKTHVRPQLVKAVVRRIKDSGASPFLVETATLYKGQRENAVKHILLAHGHGFSIEKVGAPLILADGLVGNAEELVEIEGELHQRVHVAREVLTADALLAISHATGHIGTGLGGCIKNLGMGLASRMGKMRQHSAMTPQVRPERCQLCRKCQRWCPENAIGEREGASYILMDRCIGCGECIAVCRFDAVRFDYGKESGMLQKSMAEHACGAVRDKGNKLFFFNVLVDMTRDCDCMGCAQSKMIEDIGILGSTDPVAVDMATLDLTRQRSGTDLSSLAYGHLDPMIQLRHAERLGMGRTRYDLIKVK